MSGSPLAINLAAVQTFPTGTPDGRLRFKRRLASGSDGQVFSAEGSDGGRGGGKDRRVAVKVLEDPEARRRVPHLRRMVSEWVGGERAQSIKRLCESCPPRR